MTRVLVFLFATITLSAPAVAGGANTSSDPRCPAGFFWEDGTQQCIAANWI